MVAGTYNNQIKAEQKKHGVNGDGDGDDEDGDDDDDGNGNSDSCDDDDDDGGGPLCHSRHWLVVALLSAACYCCRSLHNVM
jgi:hypothetical protein